MTIYIVNVFNLRGNQRTSGELSRREGGKIFGSGSRTPISITILVKKPRVEGKAKIYYHDIGDYLTREEKLEIIKKFGSILNPEMELSSITPNEAYDWVNKRNGLFESFIPLGDKDNKSENAYFVPRYSRGCASARDSWVYNFSKIQLELNISSMIDFYNRSVYMLRSQNKADVTDINNDLTLLDQTKISWSRGLKKDYEQRREHIYNRECLRIAMYRPFIKEHYYFDKNFNDMVYQMPKLFPTPQSKNLVICVPGIGVTREFSVLMVNTIPDLELIGKTQCFPLYYYEKVENKQRTLFEDTHEEYIRKDAISGYIMTQAQKKYGANISKEDIFFYVYAPDFVKKAAKKSSKRHGTTGSMPIFSAQIMWCISGVFCFVVI